MASFNKTSALTDSLLPEYLDDDGPKFQAFVRAYYEWLETTNQVTDRSKNLLSYQDIDSTADEFLEYFKREILSSFPKSILANKALVYKRIKDLYRAKGTEEAYRLLFRILYDEEIEFYYPGEDILRASDGRWKQDNTLRISAPFTGTITNLLGKSITGETSGASAKVERITTTFESGVEVFELFLSQIVGTFTSGEKVKDSNNLISGYIINSFGPLSGVIITFGGANNQIGDAVSFLSASGVNANGNIVKTIDNSLSIQVANGGSGYEVGNALDITGGGGSGAAFTVASISNTEIVKTYNDIIEPFSSVVLSTGPTFVSAGANTSAVSANIASANISSVLSSALNTSNTTVGSIASVTFTSRGSNYTSLPTVTAKNNRIADQNLPDGSGGIKGFNATFTPSRVAGSVSQVSINEPGTGYNRSEIITVRNNSRTSDDAIGSPIITGIINYPGAFTDTKGFLSWNNKLQDNYFYQEFSYVIRSTKAISVYRELAKTVNHPAGTKLFGEARLEANVSFVPTIVSEIDLSLENVQSIESTTTIGTISVLYVVAPDTIASTTTFGSPFVEIAIGPQSITSTSVISTDIEIDMITDVPSIAPTTVLPSHEVLQLGAGTISNFQANTIGDLSATQISEYDAFTINSLPGNRIFNGIGTLFTTQLSPGSVLKIQALEELTVTVGSIDDANTLVITANVAYGNGDLAIVSSNTYFYT